MSSFSNQEGSVVLLSTEVELLVQALTIFNIEEIASSK
jgi:hypothetical protein